MPVCSFTWRCIDVRLHYSSHHHHKRLAACFPAEVVFVEQAHCHRPHHRSGSRVYVQSRRLSTLAGTCFVAPRHRTVVSGASPPAGSVGHRLGEGSQPPAFSCGLLLLGAALTLLVDICGLSLVAGVTTTSVKCLVCANVHVIFNSLCCLHTQKCIARRRSVALPWRGRTYNTHTHALTN